MLHRFKSKTRIALGILAISALGYVYWGDEAWVRERADNYYSDRDFEIVGYQGYSLRLTGRCYRYTLLRGPRGMYESCLTKWFGEIHEHDLHRL